MAIGLPPYDFDDIESYLPEPDLPEPDLPEPDLPEPDPEYDGFHTGEINDFCGNKVREPVGEHYLEIETLEGVMRANSGDYIIRGVNGEFYPCKPDIFEKTYEEVSDA